jgi:hypothetical protein
MLKKIQTIIGIFLIILLGTNYSVYQAIAATATGQVTAGQREATEPELECFDLQPDFKNIYDDFEADIYMKETEPNMATFQNAFEEAQSYYHKYAQCMFDYAENQILQNKVNQGGTWQAKTPNELVDWLDTSAACISQEKLAEAIFNTEPNQMLPPLLELHSDYSEHLNKLIELYLLEGHEKGEDGKNLGGSDLLVTLNRNAGLLERQVIYELQNSLVAINLSFISLKELRTAFVMHVHFQCMLNNLEKYRKALENLRVIIDVLPGRLEDASMSQ